MGVPEGEGEQRRKGKSKAKELEPIKGTCAVRKGATKEFFEGLPSEEEALAVAMGAYEEDSEKENRDVGEDPPLGILHPIISTPSPPPIPIPPPVARKRPSLEKVTEDLCHC